MVGETLRRAWSMGAGPGAGRLVVDVDSTICEVAGKAKQGAAFGYTRVLGYHPILATRAGTGEVLHARMRKGSANTARGAGRFIEELVARVRRAGAVGEIVLRVDSGFWSYDTLATLARLDVRYTMAVRTGNKALARVIAAIDDDAWADIDYTPDGQAQVAETTYKGRRLIVRRTRLTDRAQRRLWPDWRHHAFLTDLDGPAGHVDAFHRRHAEVELAIRDLKEGAGLEHVPSGPLLRQRRLAVLRGAGPQPPALERHPGPAVPDRGAGRVPHGAHPPHRRPRPARQPCRHTHPAGPAALAVGRVVHRSPGGPARPARHRLSAACGRAQSTPVLIASFVLSVDSWPRRSRASWPFMLSARR
jgi:hypothetical protein